jgi:NhaP-type Na+/H+ or K+/H+ antiporter
MTDRVVVSAKAALAAASVCVLGTVATGDAGVRDLASAAGAGVLIGCSIGVAQGWNRQTRRRALVGLGGLFAVLVVVTYVLAEVVGR